MPEPNTEKVAFNEAQQEKISELIRSAMGRAGSEAKATAARLEAEAATLRSELQAAKDAAKETETLRGEVARLTGDKSGLETTLEAKQREAKSAREETIAVKKQNLIQDAAAKLGFFNPQQVAKLTGESVSWDGKQFVVLSEKDGTPRVGLDGNSPLSVDEFFREFATQNPHLVRGSVLPGIGSREATQPSHKTLGERERLAQYFGKGSSSQKANALAIESPNLYRQYKREARALGIIP